MPRVATQAKDSITLRIKYSKTTLFLPVLPTTTLKELRSDILEALSKSDQPLPEGLDPVGDGSGKSFDQLSPEEDLGLYLIDTQELENRHHNHPLSSHPPPNAIYLPLEDRGPNSNSTVQKVGLKDSDCVAVGFRLSGQAIISQPNVQLTSFEEEDEEMVEEDPDALPPALEEDQIGTRSVDKGKARAAAP
ncbi:hypothetical protein IE53DRAFT_384120 [Violaceomyces palustris]|uniref:Uncharacterized protein n=1 Tax=Violaceomyces palustris TaxID=1673888 RepID=A0ACD0P5Q8_9BASI|nr:hypothetical protein IE53DRAFT_384120 [Violaceomyces palustris]